MKAADMSMPSWQFFWQEAAGLKQNSGGCSVQPSQEREYVLSWPAPQVMWHKLHEKHGEVSMAAACDDERAR